WTGGLTYYGGLIFASIAGVRLLRKDRFPVLKACDLSAIGIAMGLGFGRVGCLLAGCCFGKHAETPFSLVFPPRSPAVDAQQKLGLLDHIGLESLPVYPTQPMESLMSFGVAGFLLFYLHPRKRYDGQIFVWFLALYAAGRFLLEFLRADDRGEAWGLSTSQIIGVILIAGAVGLHRHILRRQGEPVPA
ncbi:MAG: prolipoprotein diacylglyceryl transferase family protein, partial [Myxococcota bacterium]